ncbi:MAG: pirin family protein [Candidatus Yonathbacteria bacterium]|nr:pirin family protein [Candidatus Yonathbacteria bacterium]
MALPRFCTSEASSEYYPVGLPRGHIFDDFSSPNASDYMPGFPWHPHRGIETVTYILAGEVEHQDSMGNKGSI